MKLKPEETLGEGIYIRYYLIYLYINRFTGLPLTQGNSGNFKEIENLRETQGSFRI